ncbi:MAG: carboxypeptidase-like regulatory domain-containing protein [Ruminococcus flavefaciens]|nr:carboxypeptidase-like regulatory domain-containing protein [Ruminococcus flavefaciens]
MKSKTQLLLTCFIITIISSIWYNTQFPLYSAAKTKRPSWKKEISSLEVGKTYRYRIKHCPKKSKIQFSSNHKSIATINSKTGLLRAKKKGAVRITAKIRYSNKKIKKIKTKIQITKKQIIVTKKNNSSSPPNKIIKKNQVNDNSSILDNVSFSVAETINPWNHSIMLYSSRILLQPEIQNTELILIPTTAKANSKTNSSLTAHFSSLSEDGKTITYLLNADSTKKLCPGNGTQDGEYQITGSFFQNTLQTEYHERIHINSINGFILNSNQTSLEDVSVKLYSGTQDTPIASTTSDENGYYEFQNITENVITLKAELEYFESSSISIQNITKQNVCQNIIMHPSTSIQNLAVSCQILDKQNQPVKNTTVILMANDIDLSAETFSDTEQLLKSKSEALFLQGLVDDNGLISFANQKNISSDNYSKITYHSNQSLPEYLHEKMPVSDTIIYDSQNLITYHQKYTLYVFPSTDGTTIPKDYQIESFSFSFDPLLSEQLFFQIKLEKLPILSAEKVSINTDTLVDSDFNYRYILYDHTGKELFQTTLNSISQDNKNDYSKQLSTAFQKENIRLADGSYYVSLTAYNSNSSTKSIITDMGQAHLKAVSEDTEQSPSETISSNIEIVKVQIQNSVISSVNFTLSPCQTYHTLVYTDFNEKSIDEISFVLYQKLDTTWFPVGTYTTDSFIPIHSGQKSYLQFPVSTEKSYKLVALNSDYEIHSGAYFEISLNDEFSSSDTPEHQIILTPNSDQANNENTNSDISNPLAYLHLCTNKTHFYEEYFSNSVTYPNTVYAFYQADGTFTSLLFATPSFSSAENISSTLLYDRLQNGTNILTSQKSYSTTPFFVT